MIVAGSSPVTSMTSKRARSPTPASAACLRAAAMEASSLSYPSTRISGNALASEIAAQPSPQPISAARGSGCLETFGEAGDLWQPLRREKVHVGGPVEVALRVVEGVVGIRDPAPGAVGVDDGGRIDTVDRREEIEQRADRRQAFGVRAGTPGRRSRARSDAGSRRRWRR